MRLRAANQLIFFLQHKKLMGPRSIREIRLLTQPQKSRSLRPTTFLRLLFVRSRRQPLLRVNAANSSIAR